jgi:hypothetical protein
MAEGDAVVLGHGQINGAGDDDAIFLKLFSGEVLSAFDEANMAMDKHQVRNISQGKSAQFPATWKATASYHTAGVELDGQAINHNERVIAIDDMLVSDIFVPDIDEAKAHFQVRGEYSKQAGRSISYTLDKHIFQIGVLAAQASATITGGNGGSVLTDATYDTSGSANAAGMFDAAQAMDEKDVPEDDRYFALRPAQYYLMAQTTDVLNRDWGGSGVYSEGSVLKVAGISINKSNHTPRTNIATGPAKYQGDFSNTYGQVWHKSAMGTVKLKDLSVRMDYLPRNLGTLIVAKIAVGSGILRPESAVELQVA